MRRRGFAIVATWNPRFTLSLDISTSTKVDTNAHWGIIAKRTGQAGTRRRAIDWRLPPSGADDLRRGDARCNAWSRKSPKRQIRRTNARQKLRWKHDYYSVQCGVYSTSERAYSAAATLQGTGASIAIIRDVSEENPRYVVLAGKYRDFPSAENALKRLQNNVPERVFWWP